MIEIHDPQWYSVFGRGDAVAGFKNPEECNRDDLKVYIGQKVLIDGHEYTIKGVESFAVERQRKGWDLGFLLAEPRVTADGAEVEQGK